MQADALGCAVIDGHEDAGRALTHGHRGRHVRAPHHIGGLGGDGPVVRLRAVRVAHAVRGLEGVLPASTGAPAPGRADSLDPKLRPGFPVPFAMKRRRLGMRPIWPTRTVRPGRRPTGPRRQGDVVACRRAYTLERARCHTRQTRCTPYARRVEIEWAPFIASTSAGPKGRPPPTGPPSRRAVRSPSVTHRFLACSRRLASSRASGRPLFRLAWPAAETDPATARPAPP